MSWRTRLWRMLFIIVAATSAKTISPVWWPYVSLNCLKWSISVINMDVGLFLFFPFANSRSSVSIKKRRTINLVSSSSVATRYSCSYFVNSSVSWSARWLKVEANLPNSSRRFIEIRYLMSFVISSTPFSRIPIGRAMDSASSKPAPRLINRMIDEEEMLSRIIFITRLSIQSSEMPIS